MCIRMDYTYTIIFAFIVHDSLLGLCSDVDRESMGKAMHTLCVGGACLRCLDRGLDPISSDSIESAGDPTLKGC